MSEEIHPRADELEELSVPELVELMHAEDLRAIEAVRPQLPAIARAIELVAERLRAGGRLHYFGAGTSGRLAALDAAECAPTFGVDSSLVQAHVAGDGDTEDDAALGRELATRARMQSVDAAVAVSASGRTPLVLAAVERAKDAGVLVVSLTCAPNSRLGSAADVAIEVETGPEVVAGSTRLKAGTVQKVVLNMISTGVFTRLGHTYRGRMVDVVPANEKLRGRAQRMISELAEVSVEDAARALDEAHGSSKVAIVMLRRHVAPEAARKLLEASHGDLGAVVAIEVRP